jgi:Fe2+ or Zn2+ uptake regulation protein
VDIARYVLTTSDHPSADEVLARVRKRFPLVSRATVYDTLNLLMAKGLLISRPRSAIGCRTNAHRGRGG